MDGGKQCSNKRKANDQACRNKISKPHGGVGVELGLGVVIAAADRLGIVIGAQAAKKSRVLAASSGVVAEGGISGGTQQACGGERLASAENRAAARMARIVSVRRPVAASTQRNHMTSISRRPASLCTARYPALGDIRLAKDKINVRRK